MILIEVFNLYISSTASLDHYGIFLMEFTIYENSVQQYFILELGNFIRVKLGSTLLYKRNKRKQKISIFPLFPFYDWMVIT